nr:acyl-CoA-binding protein [uncultured Flavobacterium sp.]
MDIEKAFEEAYEKASKTKKQLPVDIKLQIYAYYKQATAGAAHQFKEPNNEDIIKAFKLNAWQQISHLTKEEAKQKYISLINSIDL